METDKASKSNATTGDKLKQPQHCSGNEWYANRQHRNITASKMAISNMKP